MRKKKKKKRKTEIRNKINDRLIKDRIVRDIRTLYEQKEEKDYYRTKRVSNFWNNNYIEYKVMVIKLETEYLKQIKSYLRDIIIDLKEYDKCKI